MARFAHPPEQKRRALEMFKQGLTSYRVSVELGISSSTAIKWQDAMGYGPERRKPGARKREAPADLREMAELLVSLQRICDHYRTSDSTARRWLAEKGIVLKTKAPKDARLPTPEGWEEASTMTKSEIARRWNLSPKVIERLIRETGVTPRRSPKATDLASVMGKANRVQVQRSLTTIEHAANHLRRIYPNVHRADIPVFENRNTTWGELHRVPKRGAGYYFVSGLGALPVENMLAVAEKHGWRASL